MITNSAASSCFSSGNLPTDCAIVKLIDPSSKNRLTRGLRRQDPDQLGPVCPSAKLLAIALPGVGGVQDTQLIQDSFQPRYLRFRGQRASLQDTADLFEQQILVGRPEPLSLPGE